MKLEKHFNILFVLFVAIITLLYGLLLFNGVISFILFSFVYYFIINIFFKEFKRTGILLYLFFSLIGLSFSYSYQLSYSNSFGPYFDDSFYFNNAKYLSELVFTAAAPTLFEVVLAVFFYIFEGVFNLKLDHLDLIPINFILSSLSMLLVLKMLRFLNGANYIIGGMLLYVVLFNFNFLDSSVHLYRDPLLIFFTLMSISYSIKNKYIKALLFAILVGLIRGANGMLCILFIIMHYYVIKKDFKIKTIILLSFLLIMVFFSIGDKISGSFLRGGLGSNDNSSIASSLEERFSNLDDNKSGSASLRNAGILGSVAFPFVYMLSPLQVSSSNPIELNYDYLQSDKDYLLGSRLSTPKFYNFEYILILLHVFFICFFIPKLFLGLYYGVRSSLKIENLISLFFIISVLLISFVSMQARHKMFFIIIFPFILSYYYKNRTISEKKITNLISGIILLIVLLYNIF